MLMKVLGRKNYGSIPHLSNSKLGEKDYNISPGQERILTEKRRDKHDKILVFEKYDGSNVGVAKKDGNIFALTRSGYEASTSPYKQHHVFAEWVGRRVEMFDEILKEGERVVGEWLYQAHGLKYKIKGDPIVFFDFFDKDNNRMPHEMLKATGLYLPRMLHNGDAIPVKELIPELNKKTNNIQAYDNPEGMIYRVERKNKIDFLAKWVRSDFKPGIYCIGISEDKLTFNTNML